MDKTPIPEFGKTPITDSVNAPAADFNKAPAAVLNKAPAADSVKAPVTEFMKTHAALLAKINNRLFAILLLAGGCLSLLVRALFDDPLSGSALAAIICCFCLLGYFSIAWRDNTGQHNPDNLYYMGFLFTLIALIYSLITLFLLHSDDLDLAKRVYNLIGSFGVALTSTFFGILFRVLLLQKPELDGTRPLSEAGGQGLSVQDGLNEAAFKLRIELTQTIADMSVFRETILQATSETTRDAQQAHAAIMQQVEAAAQAQTRVLTTLSTETSDKLSATADKMATAFHSVQESLQGILNNLQSSTQTSRNLVAEYESLNASLQQTMTFFTGLGSATGQAAENLTGATRAFADSLTEVTEVTPQYTVQFEQLITILRQEAEQWQAMTLEVRTSLVQAVEALTQAVNKS